MTHSNTPNGAVASAGGPPPAGRPASESLGSTPGIDLRQETLVRLTDVPDYVPKGHRGRPIHKSVPFRWCSRGLNGVTLEYLQVGGARCTSVEALQRFFDRLTQVTCKTGGFTPAARHRQIARAAREIGRRLGTASEGRAR